MLNQLNARPYESNISQIFLPGIFQAAPQTCSFDIDPDIIVRWIGFCQTYGVFAFSTTQFYNDWICVVKIVIPPAFVTKPIGGKLIKTKLKEVIKS